MFVELGLQLDSFFGKKIAPSRFIILLMLATLTGMGWLLLMIHLKFKDQYTDSVALRVSVCTI